MAITEGRGQGHDGGSPADGDARPSLAMVAAQFPRSALGRSDHLGRLFDYLLDKSQKGEVCREADILIDIFGKSGADALLDASTRVYVHRLRKKMDEFYAGPGGGQAYRLRIPKGEYRLAVEGRVEPADGTAAPASGPSPLRPGPRWIGSRGRLIITIVVSAALGAALILAGQSLRTSGDNYSRARQSHVWTTLLGAPRPLTIVPGDYYIMGEQDEMALAPNRLVRDFSINSREDLEHRLIDEPALRNRYIDLNLYYLPTSSGDAIAGMMHVLAPDLMAGRDIRVLASSRLTATQLRDSDILYVGLLSGLGSLRKPLFGNSRFAIGDSYDEVVDRTTHRVYSADLPRGNDVARRDYAYVAALPGPNGNHMLIAAGTRDAALLQAIDILSTPAELARLDAASRSGFFEALYAVDGVGADRFQSRLVAASPRATTGIWEAMTNLPGAITSPQ